MSPPSSFKVSLHTSEPSTIDEVVANNYARANWSSREISPFSNIVFTDEAKEGEDMGDGDAVFTVYKAANGYYAKTTNDGIVVGTTLSDVCSAAQAKVAEEALNDEGTQENRAKRIVSETAKVAAGWKKLGAYDWGTTATQARLAAYQAQVAAYEARMRAEVAIRAVRKA